MGDYHTAGCVTAVPARVTFQGRGVAGGTGPNVEAYVVFETQSAQIKHTRVRAHAYTHSHESGWNDAEYDSN